MTRIRLKDAGSEALLATASCLHAVSETISVVPEAAKIAVRNYDRNSTLEYLQDVQDAQLDENKLSTNLAIIAKYKC